MGVRDFLTEAATVAHHSRRLVVRKPTCETVGYVTILFSVEIGTAVKTWKDAGGLGTDPVELLLPLFLTNRDKLAMALSTCVELTGGSPGEMHELIASDPGNGLAEKLCRALVTVCDMRRIMASFDLDAVAAAIESLLASAGAGGDNVEGAGAAGPPVPSALEVMVDHVARRYRVTPAEVMRWPYELVLAVVDLDRKPEPLAASASELRELASKDGFGIGYTLTGPPPREN